MNPNTRETPAPPDESISTFNRHMAMTWAERYLQACSGDKGNVDILRELEQDEIDHQYVKSETSRLAHTMSIMDGFCGKCRHLLQHWPDFPNANRGSARGRSFSSVCEIEAATISGCKFCAFLYSRLVHRRMVNVLHKIESRLKAFGHDSSTSLTIQKWDDEVPLSSHVLWLNLPGTEATSYNSRNVIRFFSFITDPLPISWRHEATSDIYGLVRAWLRKCDDFHETCIRKKEYERPARLLSFSGGVVRLVRTEIFDVMPKYATLSYCWGLKPFLSLTKNTMESFLEGVSLSDLPQTFRDAIHVAKEVRLSYIWIDALCIIQHDLEDWLIESGRMTSVYGNSYVNLAASSATNVHEGFFSRPEDYKHFNAGFCALVRTNKGSAVCDFHSFEMYEEIIPSTTHLATRAWTLQERLLPVRTIFFGKTGIFWECRSGLQSEFFPDEVHLPLVPHLVCPEDQAWDWREIVTQYCCTHLTHPGDRLPALAGIARRQHEATGHQYIAGMWKESLVTDLAWEAAERRRRPAWRAPSWSWVAVDGPVGVWGSISSAPDVETKEYIRVLDVWTTPSGPDPFGKVSNGLLSLACAALVRARMLTSDELEKVSVKGKTAQYTFVAVDAMTTSLPVSMDVLDEGCGCNEVYLLPVRHGPTGMVRYLNGVRDTFDDSEEEKEYSMAMYGLVLQSRGSNTGNSGRFHRVGSFKFWNFDDDPLSEEPDNDYYPEFIQLLEEPGHEATQANNSCGLERTDYIQRYLDIAIE